MSYTNHGVVNLEEERPIGRPIRNYQEENGGQGYKHFMNKQPGTVHLFLLLLGIFFSSIYSPLNFLVPTFLLVISHFAVASHPHH